jgi:hypothetical protein
MFFKSVRLGKIAAEHTLQLLHSFRSLLPGRLKGNRASRADRQTEQPKHASCVHNAPIVFSRNRAGKTSQRAYQQSRRPEVQTWRAGNDQSAADRFYFRRDSRDKGQRLWPSVAGQFVAARRSR